MASSEGSAYSDHRLRSFLTKLRKEPTPFFYQVGRSDFLFLSLAASVGWIVFGWDGTVEQLFGGSYGSGIHWSTIQTVTLFFYLLALNFHVGGLTSFRQVGREALFDLRTIWIDIIVLSRWARRMKPMASMEEIRAR